MGSKIFGPIGLKPAPSASVQAGCAAVLQPPPPASTAGIGQEPIARWPSYSR
jgi:hypothetical protein